MDVQCERCKTEYEFDDALISARGTTVRCTHCGHQFKVRREAQAASAGDGATALEQWAVTDRGGTTRLFTTLRELQKAILAKVVGRTDMLVHGTGPARALGSISELEPFFEGRTSSSRPPPPAPLPALPGPSGREEFRVPPPPRSPARMPTDPGLGAKRGQQILTPPGPSAAARRDGAHPAPQAASSGSATDGAAPPVRSRIDTLRPPANAVAAAPPPPPQPFALTPTAAPVAPIGTIAIGAPISPPRRGAEAETEPVTLLRQHPDVPAPPPAHVATRHDGAASPTIRGPVGLAAPMETSSPLPAPTVPRRPMNSSIDEDTMAEAMRRERMSYSDAELPYGAPRRRRVGGWVIAVALLAGAAGVGYAVVLPYLKGTQSSAAQALDPKAAQLLGDGEKALADGNYESAQEDFDKASMLADKDPRVLLDLARLCAARADVDWLRLLVESKDAPDRADTQTRLKDETDRAKAAADAALAAAPDDPAAIRAKVDALRIAGDQDRARALVSKIIQDATKPETAYVLAALDLAEADPSWPTAIQRLRLAAQGEGNAGRARAALVYALARSGDKDGAKQELAKLPPKQPLSALLASFVDHAKARPDAGPSADGGLSAIDVNKLPKGALSALADGKTPMQQAMAAVQAGDPGRARAIYQMMLANNPSDSQALCGMGDVARASGDTGGAIRYYKQTLAVNPNYLPAMIGLADVYYGSGSQGAAVALYKQIVDNYPDGSYPGYVKDRAGAGAPAAPTATAAPTDTSAATAPTTSATAAPATATATDTTAAPPATTASAAPTPPATTAAPPATTVAPTAPTTAPTATGTNAL